MGSIWFKRNDANKSLMKFDMTSSKLTDHRHACQNTFVVGKVYYLEPQGRRNRGGTGSRAPPPQYLEQLVPVPLQHFQQTSGPTKCVHLQYLTPSYAPA